MSHLQAVSATRCSPIQTPSGGIGGAFAPLGTGQPSTASGFTFGLVDARTAAVKLPTTGTLMVLPAILEHSLS